MHLKMDTLNHRVIEKGRPRETKCQMFIVFNIFFQNVIVIYNLFIKTSLGVDISHIPPALSI